MPASAQHPVRYLVMDCLDFAAESKKNYCPLFGAGEQFVQSLHTFQYKLEEKRMRERELQVLRMQL